MTDQTATEIIERRRAYHRAWYLAHPEQRRLKEARRRTRLLAQGLNSRGKPIAAKPMVLAIAKDCTHAARPHSVRITQPVMRSPEWEAQGGRVQVIATLPPMPYRTIPCRGRVTGARSSA